MMLMQQTAHLTSRTASIGAGSLRQRQGLRRVAAGAAPAHPARRSSVLSVSAAASPVTESMSGVTFPATWPNLCGVEVDCLGAGCRSKALLGPIAVKVYAVALYVQGDACARELTVRGRGGLFTDGDEGTYADALIDGAFFKMLHVVMVRKVTGQQFVDALSEALAPRLKLAGQMGALAEFSAALSGKELDKGTEVILTWRPDGKLEVTLQSPKAGASALTGPKATADVVIASPVLCRALFEVYLGEASVVPDARKAFAAGAKKLLDDANAGRDPRKR